MELKEKFSKSPLIKRYQRIACVIPLVIVTASIIISIYLGSWEHFSRAGSLIVVVGIYIAIKDMSGEIYELANKDYFTMSEFLKISNIGTLEKEELEELVGKAQSVESTHQKNMKFSRYASNRFRNLETTLLIGGTIVWGYGDLFLRLIWKFNA